MRPIRMFSFLAVFSFLGFSFSLCSEREPEFRKRKVAIQIQPRQQSLNHPLFVDWATFCSFQEEKQNRNLSINCPNDNTDRPFPTLNAYGTGDLDTEVIGTIIDEATPAIFLGDTDPQPPNWHIKFNGNLVESQKVFMRVETINYPYDYYDGAYFNLTGGGTDCSGKVKGIGKGNPKRVPNTPMLEILKPVHFNNIEDIIVKGTHKNNNKVYGFMVKLDSKNDRKIKPIQAATTLLAGNNFQINFGRPAKGTYLIRVRIAGKVSSDWDQRVTRVVGKND